MRSTGEVMGIDLDFGSAFAKSQMSSGGLPDSGSVFVSIANRDKRAMIFPVKRLADLGFTIIATSGTAEVLRRNGIESKVVRKIREREPSESGEPTIVDLINDGEVAMVVNTPTGKSARADGYEIRAATTGADKPIITTVQELAAAVQGIEARRSGEIRVKSLQDHARDLDLFRGTPSRQGGLVTERATVNGSAPPARAAASSRSPVSSSRPGGSAHTST